MISMAPLRDQGVVELELRKRCGNIPRKDMGHTRSLKRYPNFEPFRPIDPHIYDEGRLVHDVVKHVLSMKRVYKTPIHSYDVFLNHRGKDVKNTLASHLYYRLRNYGLRVFFDKEEMEKGNRINLVIENAIKGAPVHVAIFSAAYAESEWCMDELLLMLQSQSIIISTQIWWNSVDGTNGVYAEALHILKEEKAFDPETLQEKPRYDSHTIEMWKEALMEVTGRDGFKLETYDGEEGKLVDMIVREVVKYTSKGR